MRVLVQANRPVLVFVFISYMYTVLGVFHKLCIMVVMIMKISNAFVIHFHKFITSFNTELTYCMIIILG